MSYKLRELVERHEVSENIPKRLLRAVMENLLPADCKVLLADKTRIPAAIPQVQGDRTWSAADEKHGISG